MADGLKNIAGTSGSVTIGGKEYRLTQWTPELIGEVEDHIVNSRPSGIVKAKEACGALGSDGKPLFSPEEQQFMISEAIRLAPMANHSCSDEEQKAFLATYEGTCFLFWRVARTHQPEVNSLKKARELFADVSEEEMVLLELDLVRASGMEALGNSPSQTQETETAPE